MSVDYIAIIPDMLGSFAVGGAAAGGAFGVIKWAAEFISKRWDAREDRLDADTRFIIDNLREELSRVVTRLGAAEIRIGDLSTQLMECQEKHGHAEAELTRFKAMMQGYGDAKDLVQTKRALEAIEQRAGLKEPEE